MNLDKNRVDIGTVREVHLQAFNSPLCATSGVITPTLCPPYTEWWPDEQANRVTATTVEDGMVVDRPPLMALRYPDECGSTASTAPLPAGVCHCHLPSSQGVSIVRPICAPAFEPAAVRGSSMQRETSLYALPPRFIPPPLIRGRRLASRVASCNIFGCY
jgi:hypothetical protein